MRRPIANREIPLAEAALRLKRRYHAARDLVLSGTLTWRRDDAGRWLVSLASVEALEAQVAQSKGAAA